MPTVSCRHKNLASRDSDQRTHKGESSHNVLPAFQPMWFCPIQCFRLQQYAWVVYTQIEFSSANSE